MRIGIMLMLGIVAINSMFYYSSETIRKKDNTTIAREILSDLEEEEVNPDLYKYIGIQKGSNVIALLNTLWMNYYELEENLPLVTYISEDDEQSELIQDKESIELLKEVIEDSHKYYIYMGECKETGLIHGIVISYNENEEYKEFAEEIANQ